MLTFKNAKSIVDVKNLDICGTQVKPEISHRDLKTGNISVCKNGTCVIGDFELTVMHNVNPPLDLSTNLRVDTKRYMSPEILDQR